MESPQGDKAGQTHGQIDSGASLHVVADRSLLHPTMRFGLEGDMNLVETAGTSLVVEFVGLLMVRLQNKKGKWFVYEAPALFVPDMTADTLLSETQLVSCRDCDETKCFRDQRVVQRVCTRDADGKLQTIMVNESGGVFLVPIRKIDCEEMRKRRTMENAHEVEIPQALGDAQVYAFTARARERHDEISFKLGRYLNVHHRCGHISQRKLHETVKSGAITGINLNDIVPVGDKHVCTVCSQGDPRRNDQPRKSFTQAKRPFDEVHIDFAYMPGEEKEQEMPLDMFLPPYVGKALVAVDMYTRWKFVQPLEDMTADNLADAITEIDETARNMVAYLLRLDGGLEHMKNFSSPFTWDEVRDVTKPIIKCIKSDQGSQIRALFGGVTGETLFVKATNFEIGIHWVHSEAYRPRQNGLIERSIGVLGVNATVVRKAAGFGTRGAYYAHEYCAFTENLFFNDSLKTTPFLMMFGKPFNAKTRRLHPFGALAYQMIEQRSKHTLPRTVGLFLGYESFPGRRYKVSSPNKREWELYHLGLAPVFEVKLVSSDTTTATFAWVRQQQIVTRMHLLEAFPRRTTVTNLRQGDAELPKEAPKIPQPAIEEEDEYFDAEEGLDIGSDDEDSIYFSALGEVGNDDGDEDEVTSALFVSGKTAYLAPPNHKHKFKAMAIRIGNGSVRKLSDVPHKEKIESQMEEFKGFLDNGIGEQMFLPPGAKLTDLKLVQTMRKDDTVKSRFAVRGFRQIYGLNYFHTYAPVATAQSVRMTIALAATFGVPLWAGDVAKAFLQAEMKEEVYIKIPNWLPYDRKKGNVLKLIKSVYGCKQSSRNWWMKLSAAIIECGLVQDKKDPCLFYKFNEKNTIQMILCVVVDDFLAAGGEDVWDGFIQHLGQKVELERASVGLAREFFGISIDQKEPHLIEIHQKTYAEEVLNRYKSKYNFQPGRGALVPLRESDTAALQNWVLDEEGSEEVNPLVLEKYMSLFGSLMFLAVWTRPDISVALSLAGTRLKSPSSRHLEALEHVLSYITQDIAKPIIYDARLTKNKVNLVGFTDADFGNDKRSGKSMTGFVTFLCGPVFWSAKKQPTVTLSTTQAESSAVLEATKELVLESLILQQMGFGSPHVPLFIDNRQTIQRVMVNSPTPASRHELIRERWISEICLKEKIVWPFYVESKENVADILTKGTIKSNAGGCAQFVKLAEMIRGAGDASTNGTRTWIESLIEKDEAFTKDSIYPSLQAYREARGDNVYSDAFKKTRLD